MVDGNKSLKERVTKFISPEKKPIDVAKKINDMMVDFSLEKRLGILSFLIAQNVGKSIEEQETQLLLDATIYSLLNTHFKPIEILTHLAMITQKTILDYPKVIEEYNTIINEKIHNGVV